jgi:ERCC4-type nuclease
MITVDERVGATNFKTRANRLEDLLSDFRRLGVKARPGKLEFGDFSWTGLYIDDRPVRVGLELKTIPDLVGSIHSGRLSGHQIPGMTRTYEFRYLMVEGGVRVDLDGLLLQPRGRDWIPTRPPTTYRQVANYLNSVELLAGLHIRRTWSSMETVSAIACLYRWWQKSWDDHNSLEHMANVQSAKAPILLNKPDLVQKVAMTLPGIGWKTAYSLAQRFKTPAELVQASLEDWEAVSGVGPKTAKRAYDALRRRI